MTNTTEQVNEQGMTRYIVMNAHDGFIYGDCQAEAPQDALNLLMDDIREPRRDEWKELTWSEATKTSKGGWLVYTVPAGFPPVKDGQDQETIDHLDSVGTPVAAFETA